MLNLLKMFLILFIWISSPIVMGDVTPKVIKVVSSNTSAYPVNKMLTEKTKINLQEGDKIKVEITFNDKTIIYPFDGPYAEKEKGFIETIIETFGDSRGIIAEHIQDANLLDVSEDSNFCYTSDAPLKLWRPDAEDEIEVSINGIPLNWQEDEKILEFPVDSLPKTGFSHLAKIGEDSYISLHKMPSELISNTSKDKWMLNNSCVRQFKDIYLVK